MKLGGGKWKETIMSAGVMEVPDLTILYSRSASIDGAQAAEHARAARRRWRGLQPGRDFRSFPSSVAVSLHKAASGAADAERCAVAHSIAAAAGLMERAYP